MIAARNWWGAFACLVAAVFVLAYTVTAAPTPLTPPGPRPTLTTPATVAPLGPGARLVRDQLADARDGITP